ncbi:Protein of unknown function [Citreimonas salinaria]|uniref:Phosphonate metabolism protein n=2 Tax=Citreimonas salinaria TaxID=321339 RepID=A0A1H3ISW4_9RHOB|nr:Protein of unknown function [Citreimonas salinaria]
MPPEGALASFGAAWLGWDAQAGRDVPQPDLPGLDTLTDAPRKYGFHATLKPPFRLAEGETVDALRDAVAELAARTARARADGLVLSRLGRFLALTPEGDNSEVARVAAACVQDLDRFRAPSSEAELERRRGAGLDARAEELLRDWGYPWVLDRFRFHMTLTGKIAREDLGRVQAMVAEALPPLPRPFMLDSLCLCGERSDGRFELLHRYALSG